MRRQRLGYFFLTTICALSLEANPLEPTVTAGHATYSYSAQNLEVHAHDKTIISWKDFSIGPNETARFNLPSKDAVILNRVGSNIPSKIEGLLSSNGIVYLLNPNGILITATGKIDTAGFLASTLNITDQDFLNGGDLIFKGAGSLTQLGTIHCHGGDVVLMASQILNEGSINSETIALGSGQEILMTLKGDERLTVRLTDADTKQEIGIHQKGKLEAVKTELKADGNLYAYAIKNEGTIQAAATSQRNGRIYLVAEKGHVTSSGILTAPGGEVRMLGQIATLTDNAKIDVSGDAGGTVLVGGDYQGKNHSIFNAESVFVEPGVRINADSLTNGNGGKVIFWSDVATYFYGKISAQGGPLGGDGGLAEVSGDYLDYKGLTNLRAPLGMTGTLLLDPTTVTITDLGSHPTNTGYTNFVCPFPYAVPNANNATIVISQPPGIGNTLLENLQLCNVTINSASGFTGSGTVTLESGLTLLSPSFNLTINAASDIIIDAGIVNLGTGGSLTLNASGSLIMNSVIATNSTSDLTLTAGQDMWVYGQIFNLASVTNVTVGGNTNLVSNIDQASISSIGLNLSSTGPLTLLGSTSNAAQITSTGDTTISAPSISLIGKVGGGAAEIQNTTGNLSVTATTGLITLLNNADITLTGGSGTLTVSSNLDDLVLQNIASISNQGSGSTMMTVGGTATLVAGQGSATISNGTGSFTFNITDNLNLSSNTGGSASITSNGPMTITAQNVSLFGLGSGQQSLIQETAGNMLIIAMNDINLDDNALIANTGAGTLTLVVDNQAPASVGTGRFILAPEAMISGGGLTRIYTAAPNGIAAGNLAFGQVNGLFVDAGLPCAFDPPPPSATYQYNTFYPLAVGGTPYTIFFKSPAPPPTAFSMAKDQVNSKPIPVARSL